MDRRLLRPSGPAPCQTMTLLACSLVPSACHAPWRPTGEATPPAQGFGSCPTSSPSPMQSEGMPSPLGVFFIKQSPYPRTAVLPISALAGLSWLPLETLILDPAPPSLPPPNFSVASPASSLHPQLSTSREWSYAVHGEKWFLTTAATSPHNTNDINRLIIRPPWMAGAPQWASSASSRGNTGPGAGLAP